MDCILDESFAKIKFNGEYNAKRLEDQGNLGNAEQYWCTIDVDGHKSITWIVRLCCKPGSMISGAITFGGVEVSVKT